jgi:single-stranded DNA-binding protein
MNILTMSARAMSYPNTRETENGTMKSTFTVETAGGELPLRFNCLAFGTTSDVASKIVEGDLLLLTGRLTTSALTRSMTVVVTRIEVLSGELN